jgi:hypothetical protein
MSTQAQYEPGPAAGAAIQKEGEVWTLVLTRDLRHPPAKVWTALTDPAHLREWAPFDSDRSLGAVGVANLTTVGAPTPKDHARGRAQAARIHLGRSQYPLGIGNVGKRRHPPQALA